MTTKWNWNKWMHMNVKRVIPETVVSNFLEAIVQFIKMFQCAVESNNTGGAKLLERMYSCTMFASNPNPVRYKHAQKKLWSVT